jgi:integrase
MGTIVQKKWKGKKGKLQTGYQAQVRMKGQFLSSTFDTRKKAKIWIEEQEMLIRKGYSISEGKKITVSDAIDRYISEISINKKAHKNEVGIWNRLKVNNSNFVNLRIAEVNPTHILHLRNKSAKRGKTVANYELKLLNHLFNNAIKLWRVVELNPVSPIERYKTQKGRYAPLYYAEYKQILKAIRHDYWLYLFILILRNGGFRPNEIFNLTHNDIDLVKNCLVVRKQKAQNTYRLVPMKAYIIKLIQESKKLHHSHKIIPSCWDTVQTRWQRMKKRIGLFDRQIYDFRRSFAHNFIDYNKGDIPTLCKIGGWADWEMAHRYYGKDNVRY